MPIDTGIASKLQTPAVLLPIGTITDGEFLRRTGNSIVSGTVGGITGSGSADTITKFTGTTAIGNSALTESATTLTVDARHILPSTNNLHDFGGSSNKWRTGYFGNLSSRAGTITADTPALDVTQTWNNGAVTFNGIKLDITNTASGSSSALIEAQVSTATILRLFPDGRLQITAAGSMFFNGRARISSPADGRFMISNTAQTDFDRLQFGGTTSSFPAIKRSSATLHARLADDSDFAELTVKNHVVTGGTVTTDLPILIATQTWNAGAQAFNALKITITDTASAATSKLIDILVGANNMFQVSKAGTVTTGQLILGGFASITGTLTLRDTSNNSQYQLSSTRLQAAAGKYIGWSNTANNATATNDIGIGRAAAGVLEVTDGNAGTLGKIRYGRDITAKTSNYTVLSADKHTFFTNTGAAGGVTFTLPTPAAGLTYEFYRDANQTVTVDVATGVTIRVGASVTTDGGDVTLDAVGSLLRIVAISATQWVGEITGAATFN